MLGSDALAGSLASRDIYSRRVATCVQQKASEDQLREDEKKRAEGGFTSGDRETDGDTANKC